MYTSRAILGKKSWNYDEPIYVTSLPQQGIGKCTHPGLKKKKALKVIVNKQIIVNSKVVAVF